MKKTVDVEISGIDFILNTDAYDLLANYLEEMEEIFISLPEKKEILEDIEARIAEEILKITKKIKVVDVDQINEILNKIGSPEEIYEMLGEFDYDQKKEVKARLYRDPDNAIIGGVASGIAAYFNVDPILIRLLFVIVTLGYGSGILIYVVLFFVMPVAKTPIQKMEMHGGGNVLRQIDKGLRDIAKRFKIPEMTRKIEEKIAEETEKFKNKKVKVKVEKNKEVKKKVTKKKINNK